MDEAFSWMLIERDSFSSMWSAITKDVHPPLYYCLLRVWCSVIGYFSAGDSVLSMRSLSVLCGVITIVLTARFARSCVPECAANRRWATVVASLLVALSGPLVRWSQEVRMYSLGTALALASSYSLLRALRASERTRRAWTVYVVWATLFLYTHNYGLLTVGAQGLICLTCWQQLSAEVRRAVLAAFAVLGGAYLPWLLVLVRQTQQVQHDYWIPHLTLWTVPDAWSLLLFPGFPFAAPPHWISGSLFLGLVAMLWSVSRPDRNARVGTRHTTEQSRREQGRAARATVLLAAGPSAFSALISLTLTPITFYRYFLFSLPFLLIALATWIARLRSAGWRWLLSVWMCVNFAIVYGDYWRQLDIPRRGGVQAAVDAIRQSDELQSDEPGASSTDAAPVLLVLDSTTFPAAKYYWPHPSRIAVFEDQQEMKNWQAAPVLTFADMVDNPQQLCVECRRIWVISGRMRPPKSLNTHWRRVDSTLQTFPHLFGCWERNVSIAAYERLD